MALGKTNAGGGGGTGGTLVVTAPVGVTVTATNSTLGKKYTRVANFEGKATFKGLASGTWSLTCSDGTTTSTPKQVAIDADYEVTLAFFSATINVTYPAGSTCKAACGTTTLNAPDASGSWSINVPNKGKWTVYCYDGATNSSSDNTDRMTVTIDEEGQVETVKLSYWDGTIYDAGDEYVDRTGGWVAVASGYGTTANKDNNCLRVGVSNTDNRAYLRTANKISLNGVTSIEAIISEQTHNSSWGGNERCKLIVSDKEDLSNLIAQAQPTTNDVQTLSLPLTDNALSDEYYIGLWAGAGTASYASMSCSKISLIGV